MLRVPIKYIPENLNKKDEKKIKKMLKKSIKLYKKNKYYTRKKVKSFKSKKSSHIKKALKMFNLKKFHINSELAKKTGCHINGLKKIMKKGQGAYYSSGSRPNQTSHSWGLARVASAVTGGKSAAIDYTILNKYCHKNSKTMKLAIKSKNKKRKKTRKIKL